MTSHTCPAYLIAAPASGQGKTTFTAALARYYKNQGKDVRVFKTGPDFLDPMILEKASGNPVYQLDLWMVGEQASKELLYRAAGEADLILIEGVMGLFDGNPSSADLAELFGIPVIALIDAGSMAQTFGAIAHGLSTYRASLPFAGVVANRVASENHADMLEESLPGDVNYLGAFFRDESVTLPERHLGLVQANEVDDIDKRLDAAAELVGTTHLSTLLQNKQSTVTFDSIDSDEIPGELKDIKIAIARDAAFGFIYPANIDLLKQLGAEIHYFSPLNDHELPEADALWLPGGYPELHLNQLSANTSMHQSIKKHFNAGKPVLAECGGMLYLSNKLTDKEGSSATMLSIIDAEATMQPRVTGLGMQAAPLPEGQLTGHTFHHSSFQTTETPITYGKRQRGQRPGEAIYRVNKLTATYIHLYFPSNYHAIVQLFNPR